MAKSPSRKAGRAGPGAGRGAWLLLAVAAAVLALAWQYRAPVKAYTQAATAYSARVACSCRYVAGRSLADCEKDKPEGLELVTLVEDPATRTVTARFPLLARDSATYREGYGCVLEKWEG